MTLKELRISKHITQEEASIICDIPIRTYKRLENNSTYSKSYKYDYAYKILNTYFSKNKASESYDIAVVGAGYVGLSIGVLLARNNNVHIVDIDKEKVDQINKRVPIFKDKEIEQFFKNRKLQLSASLPRNDLYRNKDYIFICIPTNYNNETKLLDTNGVAQLINEIRKVNKKVLIIIKSTCYIGFTESLKDKNVVYCPEFLREGKALRDNLYPSRIIIGALEKNSKVNEFAKMLRRASNNNSKVLFMSPSEAESVKLFSNAYLAMRVSFFNELDSFAIKHNIDNKNIVDGVSLDPRIGDYYNNPSFGYGGYCLPKDTLSLINQIDDNGLISSIDRSNKMRKQFIADDILSRLNSDSVVGVYKVQSKTDSDNKRYAAIIDVIEILEQRNINILYYDPNKMSLDEFKNRSDLIITNRYDSSLDDVKFKVYTRDIFRRD